jgi:bifunctional non-homologous end joining protein LigD
MPPRKSNRAIALARPNLQRKAPSGERWIHEIKWDGYRIQVHLVDERPKLFSRPGNDWTLRFPSIMAALPEIRHSSIPR